MWSWFIMVTFQLILQSTVHMTDCVITTERFEASNRSETVGGVLIHTTILAQTESKNKIKTTWTIHAFSWGGRRWRFVLFRLFFRLVPLRLYFPDLYFHDLCLPIYISNYYFRTVVSDVYFPDLYFPMFYFRDLHFLIRILPICMFRILFAYLYFPY